MDQRQNEPNIQQIPHNTPEYRLIREAFTRKYDEQSVGQTSLTDGAAWDRSIYGTGVQEDT